MRPTGRLHIGHYFGALQNWVKLQNDPSYECFYFIADWHALTSDYADTSQVSQNTIEIATDWLASGLDPQKSTFFVQSQIPEHAELHLLLSMVTPLGWLERVPTYKEQLQNITDKDLHTYGFLGYPVLQCADIVIYSQNGSDLAVPVGQDQVAHIELSREIVRRFNSFYGDTLREPQVLLTESARVPGTDGRKMSKSYNNAITLSESDDDIRKKTKVMVTDPARKRRTDPGNPDICPVYDWHKLFSTPDRDPNRLDWVQQGCRTAGIGCIECKSAMADNLIKWITPIRERRLKWEANPKGVLEILDNGSRKAQESAQQTMARVRESIFGWQSKRRSLPSL
jgi:tryptophanyl-tRNA synthetase